MTIATMEQLTERAVSALQPQDRHDDLPSPLITNENLRHYLAKATASQEALQAKTSRPGQAVLYPAAAQQTTLSESLIHCLHQLDHRTRRQDERIQELEAELAETSRRVVLLESEQE